MPSSAMIAAVLAFWFDASVQPLWFDSNAEFDAALHQHYGTLYQQAKAGELDHWGESPEGAVALVIVLDQMPRNMFRDTADAFATDDKALLVAKAAIARGLDIKLPDAQRRFLYMPFMHSERLAEQERSVELFTELGMDGVLPYAVEHHDTIARFGRFPYRNRVLGRQTTEEEAEYLQQRAR